MRKEGVVIVIIGLSLLGLSVNYYHLFNAISSFMVAGVIPGTSVLLPDNLMLACMLIALIGASAWLFRDQLSRSKKLTKLLQPKRRS